MTIADIAKLLEAEICVSEDMERQIHSACGSDMMSDVLAFSKGHTVLLTGLVNPQAIRTAVMMDMICVIFVRGKTPSKETIELARESGMVVLVTENSMFGACGILYNAGLRA